jgi:subtilisin family serine protease
MTLRRIALVAGLALVSLAPDVARGEGDPVPPRLIEKAVAEGSVRVIVRLAGSAAIPGPADSDRALPERTRIAALQGAVRASLGGADHRVVREYDAIPFLALELGPDGLRYLAARPDLVEQVEEDRLDRPLLPQSVPLVEADQAWAQGFDGAGTVVAILDTGVDGTHPFLAGKVVAEACFSSTSMTLGAKSLCPGGASSSTAPGSARNCSPAVPECIHGTHVAGIAAGAGTSFSGVARGAQIVAIQVFSRFDSAGSCAGAPPCLRSFTSDQLAALNHVYSRRGSFNFAAINMSLGGGGASSPCDTDSRKIPIDALRAAGIATVIAAGNDGSPTSIDVPACISSAVSVGSTTKSDRPSAFSNSASFLSLLAPGSAILSSVPGGGFGTLSGTSMATPHVTGAFAVLKQAAPSASVGDLLAALRASGLPIVDPRNGITTPRIRIAAALDLVADSVSAFVTGFYQTVLARPPAPGELATWVDFLEANCSAGGFAAFGHGLFESTEFRTGRPLTLDGLVTVIYRAFLRRDPEPGGLAYWADVFRRDRVVLARAAAGLVGDRADRAAMTALVTRLYREALGREPDAGGLAALVDYVVGTGDLEGAVGGFVQSAEFEARALTFRDYIGILVRVFLDVDPDPAILDLGESILLPTLFTVIDGTFIPSAEFQGQILEVCGH